MGNNYSSMHQLQQRFIQTTIEFRMDYYTPQYNGRNYLSMP